MRLSDPIDDRESGGQNPGGRNEHPWFKKPGLEALIDSHRVKVLQPELGGKGAKRSQAIGDRSRQRTRRSRILSCPAIYRALE